MTLTTGSRFFAEAMQAYGVTHIFFVPTMLWPMAMHAPLIDRGSVWLKRSVVPISLPD